MIKFYTSLTGTHVVSSRERAEIGVILGTIVSPETAEIVGFVVKDSVSGKSGVIPPSEVQRVAPEFIVVRAYDSLSAPEDLVRIARIQGGEPQILRSRVFTESGKYLGRVNEATVDMAAFVLDKIYVTPKYLVKALASDLVISRSQIVSLGRKRIVVDDSFSRGKESERAVQPLPALD